MIIVEQNGKAIISLSYDEKGDLHLDLRQINLLSGTLRDLRGVLKDFKNLVSDIKDPYVDTESVNLDKSKNSV